MGAAFREHPALVAIRKSRGVSLSEIAGATNISRYYLEAIETGALHKLPGQFYARNFVRQYARAIDYDEEQLLAMVGLNDQEEPAPPPPGRRERFVAAVRAFLLDGFGARSAQ